MARAAPINPFLLLPATIWKNVIARWLQSYCMGARMLEAANAQDIGKALDHLRFGRMHFATALIAALGLFIDIGELALNAVFSTSFPDRMAFVPTWGQSILLGSVFAGGIVGAPLFGLLADRYGRRGAMQLSMAMVAVFSAVAAITQSYWLLIACRFLSGVALGAYPPLMTAWLTDILAPRLRARIILWADALGFLGAPAVVFVVYRLDGVTVFGSDGGAFDAWRIALIGCAATAIFCSIGFWLVPESPRWLAARGQLAAARRALSRLGGLTPTPAVSGGAPAAEYGAAAPTLTAVGVEPGIQLRQRLAVIFVLYALRAVPTIVFPIMMGLVLRAKGLDLGTSLLLVATSSFGGTCGTLCASVMIERFERRTALYLCGALLIVCGLLFTAADDVTLLLFSACAFLTLGAIFGPVLSIYAAEIIPTSVRATATATAWGVTRLVSSLLPVALLPLLAGAGPGSFMAVVLGSVAISMIVIGGFAPPQPPRQSIV
ncbi:MAG: MFS transporter [Ancalomicrobiaceae bacterium]|nr:MFS transporter [Ancalomicrobiaceae bacterium]